MMTRGLRIRECPEAVRDYDIKMTDTHVELDHYSTPDCWHYKQYKDVYEPSEDSFLFLDALEQDQVSLKERKPLICVEVGCGSGILLTFLASIVGQSSYYIAVDINVEAVKCTQHSLKVNSVPNSDCLCDNLLTCIHSRLKGNVDVLLFNPPYVPTPSDEVGGTDLSASWAGGKDGREVIDIFLPQVVSMLSDGGCLYLLTVQENKPDEISQLFTKDGLSVVRILTRKAQNEHLSVLKVIK